MVDSGYVWRRFRQSWSLISSLLITHPGEPPKRCIQESKGRDVQTKRGLASRRLALFWQAIEPIIVEIVGHSSRQVTRGYRSKYWPAVQKAMEQMSHLMQTGQAPRLTP